MKIRWLILIAAILIVVLAVLLCAQTPIAQTDRSPSPIADGIKVVVAGLRNDHGRVGCSLYNGPDGFPHLGFRKMWTPINGSVAVCDFQQVAAGTYAVTVLHDENSNGKMDFNWIGIPTKGYGFSNNAKATFFAPSFAAASFTYSGVGSLAVSIAIVYR